MKVLPKVEGGKYRPWMLCGDYWSGVSCDSNVRR